MNFKFPLSVPVLTAEDMEIGPYSSKEGCGCLAYHADKTFNLGDAEDYFYNDVSAALRNAHRDLGTNVRGLMAGFETSHVHSGRISRATAARVWNRAMAMLGYVVGNPECTRAGNLRKVRK